MINTTEIKKEFPIFNSPDSNIDNAKLVYLDSAASSQKPKCVIDSIVDFYSSHNANVHRGLYALSEDATNMYEQARKKVADFIGATYPSEVIFTKGTTESLNRVAISWALNNLKKDDVILLTDIEHHSNMVPWQEEAAVVGAKIEYLEVDANGEISIEQFKEKISEKVKIVSVTHASNVLGTILPIKEISKIAHKYGALVCVDGAQAVPHMKINVQSLSCDFYAFSGHKMLGPTGIGVLWVRKEILEKLEPYEYGGGMINEVTLKKATWAEIPQKFEAGTPNISGAIALGSAIDYLQKLGMDTIREHELKITQYALSKLSEIPGMKIVGPLNAEKRAGLVSFTVADIHAHDVAAVLSGQNVAVRSGHHCAMPLHKKLGLPATTRASFYIYNDEEDIDSLVEGIKKAIKILR